MHECPECWSVCFCDLDDSNDCRDNGVCYHNCPPDECDLLDEPDEMDDPEVHSFPAPAEEKEHR